jgi:hypothetical protein
VTSARSPVNIVPMTGHRRKRTIAVTAVAGTLAVVPAMQAGLMKRRLSFRDIFSSGFAVLSSSTRMIRVSSLHRCDQARLAA